MTDAPPKTDFKLYRPCRDALRWSLRAFYRLEPIDADRIPEGGALLAANHASFLDIPAVGCSTRRFVTFVARDTLLRIPVLGWLIRHWGAILIRRGAADVSALRQIVEAAREGQLVAIYPEGTRSADGELQPLRHGVLLAARRAQVPVVPIGVAGTFAIFPRTRKVPRLRGRIVVAFGEPIRFGDAPGSADAELERLRAAIAAQMERARARWRERTGTASLSPPNTIPRAVSPSSDGAREERSSV